MKYEMEKMKVDMITLRKDEVDLIIFRIGGEFSPTAEQIDSFQDYITPTFKALGIPVLIVPKSTVEVVGIKGNICLKCDCSVGIACTVCDCHESNSM